MTPSDPPPLPPKQDVPTPAKVPDPPPAATTPVAPPVIAPAPPPLHATPEYKLEAKARYDDSPAPTPTAPPVARKATVVADRPPIPASDLPVARPVVDDDYDFDPLDADPPPGMNPVLKVILVMLALMVLLPFAGLVLLFVVCATSGTF